MRMGGFAATKPFFLQLFKQFFPPACPLCGATFLTNWDDVFCGACLDDFRPLPASHCPVCSLPFAVTANSYHLCGRCIKHPPAYTKVYVAGIYERSLRRAIQQFKFSRKVGLDRSLGRLLERTIEEELKIDLVVAVPLHHQRLQQRSYNQALLLAREIARSRNLPVASNLLLKVRETEPQQGLSAKQRLRNLQDAFVLQGDLSGQAILLVDDVMTTGATVESCSKVLLAAGARVVYVAVIARAA